VAVLQRLELGCLGGHKGVQLCHAAITLILLKAELVEVVLQIAQLHPLRTGQDEEEMTSFLSRVSVLASVRWVSERSFCSS
jgi:hypothetical protein